MDKIVSPYVVCENTLFPSERLTIPSHAIKTAKHLSYTCDLPDGFTNGKLIIGHGYEVTASSWIEITEEEIIAFAYYSYNEPARRALFKEPIKHNLQIKDFVSAVIDVNPLDQCAILILSTSSGMFKTAINGWDGTCGEILATAEGVAMTNAKLNWASDGFSRKIWVLGDSYVGIAYDSRWPYYLYRDGFNHHMIAGYSGMQAQKAIEEFKRYVKKGTPEYAVWALGMNNADSDDSINEDYLRSTEEFIFICNERGITPILATIPNVPDRNNRHKNAWIKSLPYRYIDFERAVGSDKNDHWYPDMLYQDNVHPNKKGAEALYMQVLCDFPEIMQRYT